MKTVMKISTRSFPQIKKVLLDPDVSGPKRTYVMLRDLPFLSTEKVRCDLTFIPAYRLGSEFNKTFGHIHKDRKPERYKIILGNGLFVLQKIASKDCISTIDIIEAKKGSKITIPGDCYHETINIGKSPLVLINWLSRGNENDYSLIEEKCGFGYYVIESRNAEKGYELVKNENYGEVPKAKFATSNTKLQTNPEH